MKNYNIEMVKYLFNENKYSDLIKIVNEIRQTGNYDKEDMDILNYLFKNKDVDTYLYETMVITYEEFKKKFINEEKKSNTESVEYQVEDVFESTLTTNNLKKVFSERKIVITEYKLSNEERPRISIKIDENSMPYIYSIMKNIYNEKVLDLGFEIVNLKSIEYDIFSIYLLPTQILEEYIEKQLNKMIKIIVKSVLYAVPSTNYKYCVPEKISEFVSVFENSKTKYFNESYKVSYIMTNNKDKFYLATNNKEEVLDFDEINKNKYNVNSKIVSFDNKPYVSSRNAAYVNTKTVGFVIFLTILVIICVSILTLKG